MKNKALLLFLALLLATALVACTETTTTQAPTTTTQQTTTNPPATTTTEEPATLDILSGFVSGWEGAYTTALSAGVLTVSYDKHGFAWPTLTYVVEDDLSVFNKLVISASGEGVLLVRFSTPTADHDVRFTLTSVDVNRQIDLRDIDDLDEVEAISIIALPGQSTGRGTFAVSSMVFEEGAPFGTVLELGMPEYDGTYDAWIQGGENAYTVATQLDGTVKVDYVKLVDQAYLWMKSTFDAEAAAGFNTMTVTLKGTAGNTVLVKPNDSGALERSMTFTDANPMSFTFYASNFANLVLFAQPGDTTASTGSFTIVSVVLSYTEPEVSRWDAYDFIDGTWTYNADLYDFTFAEDVLTVAWDRGESNAWTFVSYNFTEFLGNQNALLMTFQGTAGQKIIVKPNDNGAFEKTITFDGTEQTVLFQMGVSPIKILIFVDPIDNSATGTFDILQAKALFMPTGTLATTAFAENDPDTYDVGSNGLWTTIDYTKTVGQEWVFMRNTFDAEEVGDNNTLLVVLRGTVGKQVLLKPNDSGAMERWVTFTDDQPVFVWWNSDVLTQLLVFAEGGTAPVTGSFEILGVFFSYTQPDAVDRDEVIDFTFDWIDNGNTGMYSFATVDGKNVVTYNKVDGPWNNIKYTFTDNLANHNTLTFVVKGTAGKTILIKPNDNGAYERTVTFDGTEQTVVFTLDVTPTNCIIFAEGGTGTASGSFEIISATVTWEPVPAEISEGWAENDGGTYAIVVNGDGSVDVTYTKTADQTWVFMINTFDADQVAGLNTLTIVIQGTNGKTLLIKPNDSGALEVLESLDGTEQTFVFTSAAGFSKILLFAEGGDAGVTGTFTIVSMTLSYVEPE